MNGKGLKSINQYYNKKISHYREIAKRMNNLDYTKRMNKLTIKRNNKINDFIHKASKWVVDYALALDINTIIIGNNKNWKRESKMSKKVNQPFVGIPHQDFINKIIYKAENVGIKVIITEESYTSGTSFLDGDVIIAFQAKEILESPTYLTVQIGAHNHITLVPEFLQYINHSCDPNIVFDVDQMVIRAIKNIETGEELKFFYPSTEWEMDQPFICNCGSAQCLGLISGASGLDPASKLRYQVSQYIKNKWSESDHRKV